MTDIVYGLDGCQSFQAWRRFKMENIRLDSPDFNTFNKKRL